MKTNSGFSEKIKLEAKERSAFRCCICQQLFIEVHHITPKNAGGKNTLENAAPLCSSCHDLFGGNPEKRKQLRQMRDEWWATILARRQKIQEHKTLTNSLLMIDQEPANINLLKKRNCIAIYHRIFKEENFETAAVQLFEMVAKAQKISPNLYRVLYLDIDGHRLKNGAFDNDMFELQTKFLIGYLGQFLHQINMPLASLMNPRRQNNNLPDKLVIFTDTIDLRLFPNDCELNIYDSRTGKWFKPET